jgi:DNA-directed RNA polymerase specialized sigma24 family protein
MSRPIPDHGTEARYQGTVTRPACRCRHCIDGWTKAGKKRQLAALQGRPASIPTAPVTAHLLKLHSSGMSNGQIAAASNVNSSTIRDHARGAFPTIRRTTANKILAVKPKQYGDIGYLPALYSRRRCQALYAIGHGSHAIAAATSGLSVRTIEYVTYGTRRYVSVLNHRAIGEAYSTLSGIRGNATRAINRARREGWPDPTWWEDMGRIDDPDFDPAAAVEREMNRDELAALRRQEIAHLASFNVPEHEIAARLGMSPSYVHDLIRDRIHLEEAA